MLGPIDERVNILCSMHLGTADDDRRCIIDAAYQCLSEPHSGAVPIAAILQRAKVSTRAFYRHFESKDALFLAMLRQETDALAERLDRILDERRDPLEQLNAWIEGMFGLVYNARARLHFSVIDSDEVRAAKGYRELRERAHADRQRSLVRILRQGRDDGYFPLACPEYDAVAISAVVSRVLLSQSYDDHERLRQAKSDLLHFALRALGAKTLAGER